MHQFAGTHVKRYALPAPVIYVKLDGGICFRIGNRVYPFFFAVACYLLAFHPAGAILASHGVFREDNPLFSLLKLADGWLSVQDVMDWRFQPSLVTLSACQTGLSRPLYGDELLGLARGFLSAGAFSLVVSLWSVNDEVTTHLMQYFYEALLAWQGRSTALQTAMQKLRRDSRFAHPHYWAPFVLVGQP